MFHCDNAYLIPALDATGWVCKTHKTSQTAFRGFGGPQGMLVIEEILDRIARTLDRASGRRARTQFLSRRRCHALRATGEGCRAHRAIWDRTEAVQRISTPAQEIERFNAANPHMKRGIAITPVKFGISFTATFFNQAGALVLMYRDGSVQVNHGGTEMGQGLHTKIRQIAAESLGVPLDAIRVMPTRTDKVPNTSATAASAGTDLNGAAVLDACTQIQCAAGPVAANLLDCDEAAVRFEDGQAFGGRSKTESVAQRRGSRLPAARSRCSRRASIALPEIHFDPKTATGKPFHYFAYGAAVCEVEIDGFTGEHRISARRSAGGRGRFRFAAGRSRARSKAASCRASGWLTIEELLWDAQAAWRRRARPPTSCLRGRNCRKFSTWRFSSERGAGRGLRQQGGRRTAADAGDFGARSDPRRHCGVRLKAVVMTLDSPATPERIFWAIRTRRSAKASARRYSAAEIIQR